MLAALRAFVEALPATCQICAAWPSQPVCPACFERFAGPQPRCTGCAVPLTSAATLCGACQTRQGAPVLQCCVAAVDYAYPWDGLMARFKFRSEPGWARPFAQRMLQTPETLPLLQSRPLMVPIPLTARRLAERGYNQAWELVKALQAQLGQCTATPNGDTLATGLLRLGETPDQHSLGREARLRNLRGVFVAHPGFAHRLVARHVVLVDDVSTTGATLHTAAQALLQAGAARVSALVFARTPPRR